MAFQEPNVPGILFLNLSIAMRWAKMGNALYPRMSAMAIVHVLLLKKISDKAFVGCSSRSEVLIVPKGSGSNGTYLSSLG